ERCGAAPIGRGYGTCAATWVDSIASRRSMNQPSKSPVAAAPPASPNDVAQILLDVARVTASHGDLQGLLRDLSDLLHRFAHFDRLAIVLVDAERDLIWLHSLAAVEPPRVTQIELSIAESPVGEVWHTQAALLLPDLERESRFPKVVQLLRDEGMRSA